jgi:hypothetical protein
MNARRRKGCNFQVEASKLPSRFERIIWETPSIRQEFTQRTGLSD